MFAVITRRQPMRTPSHDANHLPFLLGLSLVILSLAVSQAQALEGDASAPIQVEADRLDLDDRAGTAVYQAT